MHFIPPARKHAEACGYVLGTEDLKDLGRLGCGVCCVFGLSVWGAQVIWGLTVDRF